MTAPVINGLHWSEQRLCSHPDTGLVRYRMRNGREQITEACLHCGDRGHRPWLKHADHPDRDTYPALEPHPDRCACHPTGLLDALTEVQSNTPPEQVVARPDYHAYLASPEWQERRHYFMARAMYRCQLCKRRGPGGQGLNVHHSDYSRLGAELEIDVLVLCRECHARHHNKIGSEAA